MDPAMMKLIELILFLCLAWHYIGCFWVRSPPPWRMRLCAATPTLSPQTRRPSTSTSHARSPCPGASSAKNPHPAPNPRARAALWQWYVGDLANRSLEERLRVLDVNLFLSPSDPAYHRPEFSAPAFHYLASLYWAVMMTTGLNTPIGPGLRDGQILYECLVSFFGVCLQAYMLGATASEIASMDAQDTARRQKLKAIKQHLRALRAPTFLRVPIMEYYERETTMNETQESHVRARR